MRATVDTNNVVRAVIKPTGTVGPVLGRLRDGLYRLIYSEDLGDEIADVLGRSRIRRRYGRTDDDVETLVLLFSLWGELVVPRRRITVCRDSKDDMVLEAAVAGNADVIASGDDDLLVLSPFEGIPILSPATFLRMLDARLKED